MGCSKYNEKSMFWNRILGMLKTQLPYENESCKNNLDKVFNLKTFLIYRNQMKNLKIIWQCQQ